MQENPNTLENYHEELLDSNNTERNIILTDNISSTNCINAEGTNADEANAEESAANNGVTTPNFYKASKEVNNNLSDMEANALDNISGNRNNEQNSKAWDELILHTERDDGSIAEMHLSVSRDKCSTAKDLALERKYDEENINTVENEAVLRSEYIDFTVESKHNKYGTILLKLK